MTTNLETEVPNQSAGTYGDSGQNGEGVRPEGAGQTEIEKCWSILEKAPHEFNTWEYLLKLVDVPFTKGAGKQAEEDAAELKKAYNAMLEKYPLCFGYWKKYADHINAIDGPAKATAIYEAGIKAISNSTYLWEHYLQFKIDTCDDQEVIRSLFERASECVGYDFINGHTLWDRYIEYEMAKENHSKVISIFDRVIAIPLHQYSRFFERYAAYSITRPVDELVPREVLEKIENEIKARDSQSAADSQAQKSPDGITAEIRKAIYNMKSEIYMKTQAAVHKRWMYECEIKRTYFHVTALDDAQLSAWRKYLDFEEAEGDPHRIKILYDRCLVVCALYEEFWIRHAKYLMRTGDMNAAEAVIKKACDTFIPPFRPSIRLFYAMFEEYRSRVDEARKIYESLAEKVPNHAEVVVAYAYFEKRQGCTQKAQEILSDAVKNSDAKFKGFFEIQKEKFSYAIHRDLHVLLGSYRGICERNPECKCSHLMYFTCALNFPTDTFNVVKDAWELIQKNTSLPQQSKKDFAVRYRDFLVENGGDVNDIMAVEMSVPGTAFLCDVSSLSKKRQADDPNTLRASKMLRTFPSTQGQQAQPQHPPQYAQGGTQAYSAYSAGYASVPTGSYGVFYGHQSQPAAAPASTAAYAAPPVTQNPAAQSQSTWAGYQQR